MSQPKLVLGVTGSLGTGKTSVAAMFKRLGACLIDADQIYHQLLDSRGRVYHKIVAGFGREILKKNQQIDRKKLAQVVFSNRQALKKLERITHPAIIRKIKAQLNSLRRKPNCQVIVIDAALLIEAKVSKIVDYLIVVRAKRNQQIARCKRARHLSERQIIQRIVKQLPLAQKTRLADFIIDNSASLSRTQKRVQAIWKKLSLL